jgi:hypothetical protein
MPAYDGRAARLRREARDRAIDFLKNKDPRKFAAAQVQAHDRGEGLEKGMTSEQSHWGSPERMVLALKILDIQAEAYLSLVERDDMVLQEHFTVLLNAFGERAFQNQTGYPLDQIARMASQDEVQTIQKRVSHWVNEGYKRVAGIVPGEEANNEAERATDSPEIHATEDGTARNSKPVLVARAPIQGNTKPPPSSYRFQIALSFPGESRARVQQIAENLSVSVPKESILYDRWLAPELARPNLDIYLTDLYKKESLFLVFFLSGHYAQKEWCGLEWRVGRDLLKQKQEPRLMPLRLDDAEIPGFHSIDGYLDIRDLSDAQVANAILERLATLSDGQRFPPVPTTTPEDPVEDDIPDAPEYWNQRRLQGPTPTFTEIQQRPRWCIWVRPAEFRRARFRNLDHCANFMRSFSRGPNRYPVFLEDSFERGDEWIACEREDESAHHSYLQRWVLFRSAQFVQHLALDRQIELGDRTHALEILDRVTVAYECAAAMAKEGVLSGSAALTFSFYNVDGRQLTWPKDIAGYENHVDPDNWCEDHEFEIRRIVQADRLISDGRSLALDTAMAIYGEFGWSDPPKTPLQLQQMQRFGQMN